MPKYDPRYLDSEEERLVKDLKTMETKHLKRPGQKEQAKVRRAARAYVAKELKMNIRIDAGELAQIKARAEVEGLKYQTLVKSVLHKYLTGQLVERRKKIV